MTEATVRRSRPAASWWPLAPLALLSYVPMLLTQPGWLSADTKTYLYLDPGQLLGRASSMWDPATGLGTVSHQSIGYLWPMGPWFWAFDALRVADWVAQRLWWGTMLVAAGAGVAYLLRRFDWPTNAAWAAAFSYALSPYVLTHIGRLSAVLLPFVGLPWLVGFAVQSVRHRGWRHPALFALTVATVGSVNLTALALAGLGPVLWLVHAALTRRATVAAVVAAAGKIGIATVAVSAWWIAGLSVQATNGLDVVRYTETADVVTATTTAPEVLRGLGYWFFYGGDRLAPWVPASHDYMAHPWLLLASFALPVLALAGAAAARWPQRSFAIVLTALGTFVAVGAHPWDDPTPVGEVVQSLLGTDRGLAFRSLARAVPLVALGLAMLAGAGVGALAGRWPRQRVLNVLVPLLAVLALPPLWQGDLVSADLRFRSVPNHWREVAAAADAKGSSTRVLELPGSDFAHYRWGATVDPVTPGLTDRPSAARELVPSGSPAAADLLTALDERLQAGTLDPAALAPVARLLRAGDLLLRNDLEVERFGLVPPADVWAVVAAADGLGTPDAFGPTTAGIPPVALIPVEGTPPILTVQAGRQPVLLSGDGAGIVDAATAGLLTGREVIRYGATLEPGEVAEEIEAGATLVVTDTNRKAARRWRSVHDTRGFTEPADAGLLRTDTSDNRLPLFPDAPDGSIAVAEHRGGLTATATSYGGTDVYDPELRPVAALDGDQATSWLTATGRDPAGERLRITLDEPRPVDRLRLVQGPAGASGRALTAVELRLDGGDPRVIDLDDTSRTADGQLLTFPERTVTTVELTLLRAEATSDAGAGGPVGFAEVVVDDDPALVVDEVIRVPRYLLDAAAGDGGEAPLAIVLTRLRSAPDGSDGADEEPDLRRVFTLPVGRTFTLAGRAHLAAEPTAAPAGDACRTDLIELDGVPLPVRTTLLPGPAGGSGRRAITGCGEVALGSGDHVLRTAAAADVDVDQVVLSSGLAGRPAAPQPAADVQVTGDDRNQIRARVAGPVRDGDWLVLGQSFNDGWRASADGVDLGAPQLLDGFANGWRLPATDSGMDVELRFRPQQRVDAALLVSAAAAVAALVLALRRPGPGAPDERRSPALAWMARRPGPPPTWPRSLAATLASVAIGVLLVSPAAGLVSGTAALAAVRNGASRTALSLAPPLLLASAATYVVAVQVRDDLAPGLFWPTQVDRVHPIAGLAIVLLLVGAVADWAWPSPPTDSPDS